MKRVGDKAGDDRGVPDLTRTVSLPLWLAALLLLLAAAATVERLLLPGVRWFFRRRTRAVLDEMNRRLPIRIQPFKLTKRRVLIDRLVEDPAVVAAAEAAGQESGLSKDEAMGRVLRYAEEIVPAFNAYVYFRVGYFLARRAAQALYRVRLGFADEAALAAIPEGSTVVFLMNHRSNMDYVLVSYLAAERTALSYAVGEWARVWPLQTLFKAMGAYFIRRDSRNALYRRVLERYVAMATAGGVTQAAFPEGGLSRDGNLRPPRLGLLDYMLRGFDPRGERDLVLVPVGINYDRVLEDRTLLLDVDPDAERASPAAKAAAFLGKNLLLLARNRWHRFGYACVNFGTPLSLRAWLADRGLDPRSASKEERAAHVAALGAEAMRRIAAVVPVLPVPLVAAVFAEQPEARLTGLELSAEVLRRMDALAGRGARVYLPRRDRAYAIEVGVRMLVLRRVLVLEDGFYRARPEEALLLRYYANSIRHFEEAEPL